MRKLFVSLLTLSTLSACKHEPSQSDTTLGPKVPVTVAKIASIAAVATERVPGSVKAKIESTIEAKVNGRISELPVKQGDVVKEGQTLMIIDAKEIQARLEQAKATLNQSEKDFKRLASLLSSGVVTKQEYDAAEARYKLSEASVNEARTMVGYTQVTAPFNGLVTEKLIEAGDFALPGKPLLRLEQQGGFNFETFIPESLLGDLKLGTELSVTLSGSDTTLQGKIAEIAPTTDPNSRTLKVKIELPQSTLLRSGQFGYALVPAAKEQAIRVPNSAVLKRGQLELVYVEHNGFAQMRIVRLGKQLGSETEILSGLEDGENLITSDVQSLNDGSAVEIAK